jgi:DNA-binding HxlR family transcriptional regulator
MSEVHKVCVRFHTAIELLGGRWTGAVLRALVTGSHRFAEIKAAVPNLSDTMLAQRLRELEAAGLVERHVMATSPVRVEYQLTQMGREVNPILDAVIAWSHRWIPLPAENEDDSTSHPEGSIVS